MRIRNLTALKGIISARDVIAKFVDLKPYGNTLKGNCPFHEEKTPSFVVNAKTNNFFCYGCNKGGDSFDFIQELKGLDFLDSVRYVARLYNFALDEDVMHVSVPHSRMILERAFDLFKQALGVSQQVKDYLYQRGLNDDLISKFELGFCSVEVCNKLKEEYKQQDLIKCGLGNDKGNISFYKRLMIPFKDIHGQLCGFSARLLKMFGMFDSAKYLNSRDSEIFSKSLILVNFDKAKASIESKKQVIITEGYFEVIALEAWGYSNAICCAGCNFSQTHLDQLIRLSKRLGQLEIIFCFDSDSAGRRAVMQALFLCFKQGYLNVGVLYFKQVEGKEFKDLGDFLRAGIRPQLMKADGFKFLCRRCFLPTYDAARKDNNYKALFGLIKDYPPFLKYQCQQVILSFIPKEVKQFINTQPLSKLDINKLDTRFLEGRILATMLEDSEFKYIVSRYLSGRDFPVMHQLYRAIFEGNTGCLASLKRFVLIEKDHWGTILEAFKRDSLNHSLTEAIKAKDMHLARLLQEKLAQLVKPM
ncbi:CHC2 zinc finger domain-containing protein [Helicobacter suis]|uniref:CHC2 zinc finger domain-containing protein n=1 Tax=Helicobacter suis TaxID=104628 RepID=UPI0013CFB42D|nr:CHC2 zinc finger domain-containing protein [Helicobacter suis]